MTARPWPPFYMIRHGETDWNREGRYQGRVDVPLNRRGREQAAANGRHLNSLPVDWSLWNFIASPFDRACETMRIVRDAIGLPSDVFLTDQRLVEVSFGAWERKLSSELQDEFPEEMARREANKWEHVPPGGGESYAQAVGRVRQFLDDLTLPAVIVCHGGILRATRFLIGDGEPDMIANEAVPQDRIYRVDADGANWIGPV